MVEPVERDARVVLSAFRRVREDAGVGVVRDCDECGPFVVSSGRNRAVLFFCSSQYLGYPCFLAGERLPVGLESYEKQLLSFFTQR